MSDRSKLREKSLFWHTEDLVIVVGKAWQQKQSVAACIASAVGKHRRMNVENWLLFSFLCSLGSQPMRWCPPQSRWIFL